MPSKCLGIRHLHRCPVNMVIHLKCSNPVPMIGHISGNQQDRSKSSERSGKTGPREGIETSTSTQMLVTSANLFGREIFELHVRIAYKTRNGKKWLLSEQKGVNMVPNLPY